MRRQRDKEIVFYCRELLIGRVCTDIQNVKEGSIGDEYGEYFGG